MDLGLPEAASRVAQACCPHPVPRSVGRISGAGDRIRGVVLVRDLGVAADALHLLGPEPDVRLVDEEPRLGTIHVNELTDELSVVLESLRVHALQKQKGGLQDQPGLPPRVEVGGARELRPLPHARLHLKGEGHQCELPKCPLALRTEEGEVHVRGLTRVQELRDRRELILRGLHVLVGIVPTGTLVLPEQSADLRSLQRDELRIRRGVHQTRQLDSLGRLTESAYEGSGSRSRLGAHTFHG